RDRDRILEERLLPSARRFAAKGHGAEQRSLAGPKMTHVFAAVRGGAFVKPNAGNEAVTVGTEFQAEFHSVPIICYRVFRRGGRRPYREGCDRRWRRRCGK